jgi:PmbA protein
MNLDLVNLMSATEDVNDQSGNQQLLDVTQQALDEAKRRGASEADAAVSRSHGFSVTVRLGDVETVEYNRDKNLVVNVYFGHRSGSASTSDFAPHAVADTVRAACSIAKYTAEDPCAGLADRDRLAKHIVELDLDHPWELTVDAAIDLARDCEDHAREVDKRITNSEGASVSTHRGTEAYANTHGFEGLVTGTRHSMGCAVIGEQDGLMQRDFWYSAARDPGDLESPPDVGETAARRALRRLGARQITTREAPVLFEAPIASSLLSHFLAAVRGSSLYRKASFLLDQLGQPVFPSFVRIHEQPHLPKAVGSAAFDNEGVTTENRDLVTGGVLRGYVLDSYSARKLGMETTGNAGGVRNLTIEPGALDLMGLLKEMDTGLLVTELIGFGVNVVTGDYSRGAAGFWVEGGEIQYPVEEITIAGNLMAMFQRIAQVGNDVDLRGNIRCGSILLEKLTIAGA